MTLVVNMDIDCAGICIAMSNTLPHRLLIDNFSSFSLYLSSKAVRERTHDWDELLPSTILSTSLPILPITYSYGAPTFTLYTCNDFYYYYHHYYNEKNTI